MPDRIYPAQWMHHSKEMRDKIARDFDLSRTGVTEIRDQDVISDGYTVHDLANITLNKMCAYIGSEETFARAWELTIAKVYSELHPPAGTIGSAPAVLLQPPVEDLKEPLPEVTTTSTAPTTVINSYPNGKEKKGK